MHEASLFRRGRPPLPAWPRVVLVGWLLIVPLTVVGLAAAGDIGDCFSSCPPPPPETEESLRYTLAPAAILLWLALPSLVVAGLRWPLVRGLIAFLAVGFGAIAIAGAFGVGGYGTGWMSATWPASVLIAAAAILPIRARAGTATATATSVPSDVVLTAGGTILAIVMIGGGLGFLITAAIIGIVVVTGFGSKRGRPAS